MAKMIRTGFGAGIIALSIVIALCFAARASMHQKRFEKQPADDSSELARLYEEDQADRAPADARAIDWSVVGKRDAARLARVKELYDQNRLKTARDYYHAAMILQHGHVPEDFLLAHEFCVVAISKGKNDKDARWLCAASEDRFLNNIGRRQRFATQYVAEANGLTG